MDIAQCDGDGEQSDSGGHDGGRAAMLAGMVRVRVLGRDSRRPWLVAWSYVRGRACTCTSAAGTATPSTRQGDRA